MGVASQPATGFGGLSIGSRSGKPRDTGLTIMVEFGLGEQAQRDLLDIASETLDLAKIAVGIPALIPSSVLERKIALYREYRVEAFPGGMFLEYAYAQDEVSAYFKAARSVGFEVVEVSDNAVVIAADAKMALVCEAKDAGFTVLGEVGNKHSQSTVEYLLADAQRLLDAGCWKVLIEAAELLEGQQIRTELLRAVETDLPLKNIVFELPGPWLSGVHQHQVCGLESWLVERFGSEVNIANDPVGNSLFLETYRRGIGPNMLRDAS